MATTIEPKPKLVVDRKRIVTRLVEAAERTLAVRREVWDLIGDGNVDEHFLAVILSLYRDERGARGRPDVGR